MEGTRRPLGIWVIVALQLVNAGLTLADIMLGTDLARGQVQRLLASGDILRWVAGGWAVLIVVAGVLLWRLDRRGWALMMLLVGVSLVVNLAVWWDRPADTQWVRMTLSTVTAFYLNSTAVRRLFLRHHEVSRITLSERQGP